MLKYCKYYRYKFNEFIATVEYKDIRILRFGYLYLLV